MPLTPQPINSNGSIVAMEEDSATRADCVWPVFYYYYLFIRTVIDQTSSMTFDAMRRLGHELCETQSRCKNEK